MESTAVSQDSKDRLAKTICDILGVLFGLLFMAAGLFLLDGTINYIRFGGSGGRHINSAIGSALGVMVLLFLSVCLALPTRLHEDRRLRIAGHLAASMTSAVTVAAAVFTIAVLVYSRVAEPPSPGSAGADVVGIVVFFITIIGLAANVVFIPCTCILARKARMRLAHLAIGTAIAGAAGGLLGYLCY